MNDLDDSITRLLEQEKLLLSVLGQAIAKLKTSKNETEIKKYRKFVEDGMELMIQVEEKLGIVFGKRPVAGDN